MSTDTWDGYVTNIYSDVIGEADNESGIRCKDAFDIAVPRIADAVRAGEIEVNLDRVIRQSLDRADKAQGKRADKLIAATVRGELTIFDSVEDLDTVVTLGAGRRKLWRHVNQDDLMQMDEVRYQNVEAAQKAYAAWRDDFTAARKALRVFPTVEAAISAGAFTPASAAA